MGTKPEKVVTDLTGKLGPYPEEAYAFLQEGLSYSMERIHGPLTPVLQALQKYMAETGLDAAEIVERYERGELPESLTETIVNVGGPDKLNRHVSGQDLCWSLRDFAIQRWGKLARLVLERWNLRETMDFGRMVFTLIEHDFMRKEPHDCLEDFRDIYDFRTAFSDPARPVPEDEENDASYS